MWRKTRWLAYTTVVVFHALTAILFPIGMFPYVMIICALIFFSPDFHNKIIQGTASFFQIRKWAELPQRTFAFGKKGSLAKVGTDGVHIPAIAPPLFVICFIPANCFGRKKVMRFSWRVMLMEKNGYTIFTVKEPATGKKQIVNNNDYLSRLQEKQMSFQPDMILEFAHHIAGGYENMGWKNPAVYAESYVTLNGRPSRLFIDTTTNLAAERESLRHKKWILPLNDAIKGF